MDEIDKILEDWFNEWWPEEITTNQSNVAETVHRAPKPRERSSDAEYDSLPF